MDTSLSTFIEINQFPTGRRLFAFHRVLEVATTLQVVNIADLVKKAIAADEGALKLEQRWAQQRRSGKTSAKQAKAQKAAQALDGRVDKAVSGLRDAAEALIRGAGDDEKELVTDVEHFLDAAFPNGVHAITSLPFDEESVAVNAIAQKLSGDLAPLVTKLGLSVHSSRLAKLAADYEEAIKSADTLEFGKVKAARAAGQEYLLRVIAKILGTFDEPTGEHAVKRAALLSPILKQNQAISDHIRARRAAPDVDPKTGEEDLPDTTVLADGGPDAEGGK